MDGRNKCVGIDVRFVLPLDSRCSPICPTYRAILGVKPTLDREFMHSTPELFFSRVTAIDGKAGRTVLLDVPTKMV